MMDLTRIIMNCSIIRRKNEEHNGMKDKSIKLMNKLYWWFFTNRWPGRNARK